MRAIGRGLIGAASLLAAIAGCSPADKDAPRSDATHDERPAEAAAEQKAKRTDPRPNIVFAVYDNTRFDRYSINGNTRKTSPFFDRLAGEGLYIAKGIAPATWTFPSHASMFTGFHNHQLKVDFYQSNHLVIDPKVRSITQVLDENGYYTVSYPDHPYFGPVSASLTRGFLRFDILFNPLETPSLAFSNTPIGWLMDRRQRVPAPTAADTQAVIDEYHEKLGSERADYVKPPPETEIFPPVRPFVEKYVEERYADLIDTLNQRGDEPFYLFLNLHNGPKHVTTENANNRWLIEYLTANNLGAVPLDKFNDLDDGFLKSDYVLAFCDATMEILYEKITQTPGMENTVFIIASDHGQAHGEHKEKLYYKHGNAWPWHYMVHVPAAIHFPESSGDEQPKGRMDRWVSLRELFFTIAEIAGCEETDYVQQVAGERGRSLLDRFRNENYPPFVATESHAVIDYREIADLVPEVRKRYQISFNQQLTGEAYAIYAGDFKYIIAPALKIDGGSRRNKIDTVMLFDVATDAAELTNLRDDRRDVVVQMVQYFLEHKRAEESLDFQSLPALPFDEDTARQLRALGYAE